MSNNTNNIKLEDFRKDILDCLNKLKSYKKIKKEDHAIFLMHFFPIGHDYPMRFRELTNIINKIFINPRPLKENTVIKRYTRVEAKITSCLQETGKYTRFEIKFCWEVLELYYKVYYRREH